MVEKVQAHWRRSNYEMTEIFMTENKSQGIGKVAANSIVVAKIVAHSFSSNPVIILGLLLFLNVVSNEQVQDAGISLLELDGSLSVARFVFPPALAATFIYLTSHWSGRIYLERKSLEKLKRETKIGVVLLQIIPFAALISVLVGVVVIYLKSFQEAWYLIVGSIFIAGCIVLVYNNSDARSQFSVAALVILTNVLTLISCFNASASGFFGVVSILLVGFAVWLGMLNFVFIKSTFGLNIPVLIPIVFIVALVRAIGSEDPYRLPLGHSPFSTSVEDYVGQTLNEHFADWLLARFDPNSSEPIDVQMVAAEGGGIRAAYWTALVLASQYKNDPQASFNTYAYSGVSGGSLGIAAFTEARRANLSPELVSDCINGFFKSDFLSPLVASLFVTEPLRFILPESLRPPRRDQVFERSLASAWKKACNNDGFSKMFQLEKAGEKRIPGPLLIFNATHVETGRQLALTNVYNYGPSEAIWFSGITYLKRPYLTLAETVHLSARFPIVSAPASLYTGALDQGSGTSIGLLCTMSSDSSICKSSQVYRFGTIVDGGYIDNSGTLTLLDVYRKLSEFRNRPEAGRLDAKQMERLTRILKRVNFKISLISTSFEEPPEPLPTFEENLPPFLSHATEMRIAVQTLLIARENRSESAVRTLEGELKMRSNRAGCEPSKGVETPESSLMQRRTNCKYSDELSYISLRDRIVGMKQDTWGQFSILGRWQAAGMLDECDELIMQDKSSKPPLGWVLSKKSYNQILCAGMP
jgi:hypothetical protein